MPEKHQRVAGARLFESALNLTLSLQDKLQACIGFMEDFRSSPGGL